MRATILALLALAGCSSTGADRPAADLAPFPYTPEEIRAAHPAGTRHVYRIEQWNATPVLQVTHFTACDAGGARMESVETAIDGSPIGQPRVTHAGWVELRDHASFPADRTTVSEETIEVEGGKFDCRLYAVLGDDGETTRFWFARARPGPPVLMTIEPEDGRPVFRMELVETRVP